jgi:hypothetical protein
MGTGELLDLSSRLYQTMGPTILRLTAVPTLACVASVAFVLDYVLPAFGVTRAPESVGAQVGEAAVHLFVALGIASPLFLLGLSYSMGIVVALVSDYMLGNLPDPENAVRTARRSLRTTLLVNLYEVLVGWSGVIAATFFLMLSALLSESMPQDNLAAGGVAALAVFSYIVGFLVLPFVLGRHLLAAPAAIVERLATVAAIRRSTELLAGTRWQPSGYGAVMALIGLVMCLLVLVTTGIALSIGIVGSLEESKLFTDYPVLGELLAKIGHLIPWYLAIWTLVPVWCATATILYYERRIRLEGFDIESLAKDVWRTDRQSRFEL